VQVAWETKGEDILVLHVAPVVYWTRYFLIATVFSRPQLNAVLGKMTKEAAEVFDRRLSASPQAGCDAVNKWHADLMRASFPHHQQNVQSCTVLLFQACPACPYVCRPGGWELLDYGDGECYRAHGLPVDVPDTFVGLVLGLASAVCVLTLKSCCPPLPWSPGCLCQLSCTS
jgi:hypothetical protein